MGTMGLLDSATKEEIRQKYKELALTHHPDRNAGDIDGATQRFQEVKEAYQALKDTDGELHFPWDEYPDSQQVMTGDDALTNFAKLGREACDENHLAAVQLRHLVKSSSEVKVVLQKACEEHVQECWAHALCIDARTSSEHIIRIYRKDVT